MPDSTKMLPMAADQGTGGAPVFDRIAVVGLGLIGGSIALAARQAWPAALVIGVDRNDVLEKAMIRHAIDVASEDLMIISEAELVILATPVGSILELLPKLPTHVGTDAVVTDVGSTKRAVMNAAKALPPRLPFVGGHPLAGAARGGFEMARPDLFTGRPWLLTTGTHDRHESVQRLSAFVEGLGARPVVVPSPEAHDRLLAFLSHLPQLAASALMAVIGEQAGDEGLALAGRGLVDTTRLAASPADVWRDVCRTNADEIGPAIDLLVAQLQEFRRGLEQDAEVDRVFEAANRWRARLESFRS
jgi:prephenate dehydrogenase